MLNSSNWRTEFSMKLTKRHIVRKWNTEHWFENSSFSAAHNMLKQISDDLFLVAETISTQLRKVNFEGFYSGVSYISDPKKTPTLKVIQYRYFVATESFHAASVPVGTYLLWSPVYSSCWHWFSCLECSTEFVAEDQHTTMMTVALEVLVASFMHCKSDLSNWNYKQFNFSGIWVFLLIFVILAAGTAIVMFSVGNFSNLVCQPLRNPLSHPDSLSVSTKVVYKSVITLFQLAERYINIWKSGHTPENDIEATLQSRSPAELIRACSRNETLYNFYEFDKKYHLNKLQVWNPFLTKTEFLNVRILKRMRTTSCKSS